MRIKGVRKPTSLALSHTANELADLLLHYTCINKHPVGANQHHTQCPRQSPHERDKQEVQDRRTHDDIDADLKEAGYRDLVE